ncbi:M48 family metalloprotease [Marinobacterium lutimaris]|uniref:Putative Zn-dependent protease, contains TPR repeats n=1 Tax=Marinobacterium lutimaris TaxID=568106 RepID=A0A1H5WPX2_9GAMM|nr:M48 family metalloprotease [Marinobacterium lutimaris]SEG01420.1 Putative Zn-dependent protease, contains TPR repeats [Marinobacterium lutimaris]
MLLDDPMVKQYLQDLLWKIVPSSELRDRRLELIALDNETFNAFAVPGGIVGVHGGLITASESEAELASVLAHELAHLSQRHYAQQLEESRRNRPLVLAGVLASILLGAANGEAGSAGIASTLGGSASAQLAFSRRNEQEADRVGMQTLVRSGFDPYAMPEMFSRLQKTYRFAGNRAPEFLLTHPVTESRIADSLNRASNLNRPADQANSLDYDVVRTRLLVHYGQDMSGLNAQFSNDAKSSPRATYGLLLTAIELNKPQQAQAALEMLPRQWQQHLYVKLTTLDFYLRTEKTQEALKLAKELHDLYPGSMPATYYYGLTLRQARDFRGASNAFKELTSDYPDDAAFWFQLSETQGLEGNIGAVHRSRIEYFLLTGRIDRAQRQLEFARREKGLSPIDTARLDQMEEEIKRVRQEMDDTLS